MLTKLKSYLTLESDDRITFEGHVKDLFIGKRVVVGTDNRNDSFCKEGVVGDVAFYVNRKGRLIIVFYWIKSSESKLPSRSPEFDLLTPIKIVEKCSKETERQYHIGKTLERIDKEVCSWLNFDIPKGFEVYYSGSLPDELGKLVTVQLMPSERRPFFVELPSDKVSFNEKKELIQNSLF